MAVADILKDIGQGVATAGKAAVPVLERTAQVVSGEAPQIDQEKRQQQYKLEDQQIATKAQELEAQLEMGRKYGTLTPEQQQQYVDQISGLYSHPRHAPTLMEKLRKMTHPNGAVAMGPQAPLKDATPPGGTAATDEQNREKALADTLGLRQQATDEEIDRRAKVAAQYHKPAGKSPPTPGSQLPPDAIGPDGQPISMTDRSAGKSFIEWNGAWYPAPKAKPQYKIIKGNVVLMDPATGLPMRNLGPSAGVKMSTHQTPFLGDDGQMHLLTTTSVTTPQGEQVEVEQAPPESEGQPSAGAANPSAPTSQTPARKVNPGSILPKTGAKPASGQSGPAIPGSRTWAESKSPLGKSDAAQYTKVAEDANQKKIAYESAKKGLEAPTASSDQELIYAWVRSNVQGAGRMTQAEFRQASSTGSLPLRAQGWFEKAKSGRLPPELEQMLLADIKHSAETAQKEADLLRGNLQGGSAPPASDPDIDAIVNALKGGKK